MFIRFKRAIIGFLLIFRFNSCTRLFETKEDQIIQLVNSIPKSTWTAGINFRPGVLKNVSHLMGVQPWYELSASDILHTYESPVTHGGPLPDGYDITSEWSECKSVVSIRDQSNCGSCWALATASVFGDRLCIASNGTVNKVLSGEYINSCCTDKCGNGCNGGHPEKAWKFIKKRGLCTGGEYASKEGCQPYSIAPCPRDDYCMNKNEVTPPCSKNQCTNSDYDQPLPSDLYFASKVYSVKPKMETIMNEIYTNGPVVSAMKVYDDFLHYKGGIYQYTTGELQGDHAIRLLGWGQDDGIDYWLCANTWGTSWGMRGMFKIRRGRNECGIETRITGGLPIV